MTIKEALMRARGLLICGLAAFGLVAAPATAQLSRTPTVESRVDPRAEVYGKMLNTTLTVEFNENPLRDVVDFLATIGDVDILTQWQDPTSFGGEGLDPERPITLVLNRQTSLLTVLELVLEQASDVECSWSLGEGFIKIGTKDMLDKDRYVMIYPVRELLLSVPTFDNAPELDLNALLQETSNIGQGGGGGGGGQFFDEDEEEDTARQSEDEAADELMDIIMEIVDPYRWELAGGTGGSMRYFRGSLIVNAADYLHRQVAGYPFEPAPQRLLSSAGSGAAMVSAYNVPRYVTLTGDWGMSEVVEIQQTQIPVLVGGRVILSGDDNP